MSLNTFSPGTLAQSAQVNANFNFVMATIVPIGAILPWCKNLTGVPVLSEWFVECNGQVLSDITSPLNGLTMPNLNGTTEDNKRFLRGALTSGGIGGTASTGASGYTTAWTYASHIWTPAHSNIPPYYEVVWIIKIK